MKNKVRFREYLIRWYKEKYRRLPWRETSDPYHIWVSEVMLQQTQVKTVIPYYHHFLNRFKNITVLASAEIQDVLKLWEGLGYYARARNLHRAALIVVETYEGKIPDDWSLFRKLPGVGEYIASAVQSIAFGQPYPVVDGNVKRVLARYLQIETPVNHSASITPFKDAARQLLDSKNPGMFNQAIMELGAVVCRVKNPLCSHCPVQSLCQACQSETTGDYPKRIKRDPIPEYHLAAGVVYHNGQFLITHRPPEGLLGGLWEFPCEKIQDNESPETACVRTLFEKIGMAVKIDSYIGRIKHAYTHYKIIMEGFRCRYVSGDIQLDGPVDYRWVMPHEIEQYPFTKASLKMMSLLCLKPKNLT